MAAWWRLPGEVARNGSGVGITAGPRHFLRTGALGLRDNFLNIAFTTATGWKYKDPHLQCAFQEVRGRMALLWMPAVRTPLNLLPTLFIRLTYRSCVRL